MLQHNHHTTLITVPHWGIGATITAIASWMQKPGYYTHYAKYITIINNTKTPTYTHTNRNSRYLPTNQLMNPRKLNQIRPQAQTHIKLNVPTPQIPPHTLGIHYRGTDKYKETGPPPPLKTVLELAEQLAKEKQLTNILLCTDDSRIKPPPHIITFPHLRNTTGLHHDKTIAKRHQQEAATELLALAQCDHLLVCTSCFSEAALILGNSTYTYY
jgi:hypothetical protein